MRYLTEYLNRLPKPERTEFARRCGTTEGYLRKAASTKQRLGAELCVALEQESHGAISRRSLRPDDWMRIWPELVQRAPGSAQKEDNHA